MKTFSLQSGSNGNSIYVETQGIRLLFDAGLSGRQAELRMEQHGLDIRRIDALILSHDHLDHVRGAGIFHRKFGCPIHATQPTFQNAQPVLGRVAGACFFSAGDTLDFGGVKVSTLPTPHDGVDGVCFVVESNGKKLGILTDLGCPFPALRQTLAELDAVYLESNYDPSMLARGSYPQPLKDRIQSDSGHLSNDEAAELIHSAGPARFKWIALAHLSEENNSPRVAIQAMKKRTNGASTVLAASRHEASLLLEV